MGKMNCGKVEVVMYSTFGGGRDDREEILYIYMTKVDAVNVWCVRKAPYKVREQNAKMPKRD